MSIYIGEYIPVTVLSTTHRVPIISDPVLGAFHTLIATSSVVLASQSRKRGYEFK